MRVLFALPGLHRIDRGAEIAFISVAIELTKMGHDVALAGSGYAREGTPYRFLHIPSLSRRRFERFPAVPPFRDVTAYEELTFIPDYANEDEGLKVAFIEADKHNWSKEDLIAYDNASIAEQDERGKLTFAEKKGAKATRLEAIKGLHQNGVPISIIAKSLNLTEEEVSAIIENQANK